MSLSIQEDTNNILGRKYNVEYKVNNDSIHTFSNVLTNVDGNYFWFSSLEDGLDIVRQDKIVTMICLERNKPSTKCVSNNIDSFDVAVYCFTGDDGIFVCDNCVDPD